MQLKRTVKSEQAISQVPYIPNDSVNDMSLKGGTEFSL